MGTTSLGTIIPTTIHNNTTIMAGSKKVLMLGAGFVTKPTLDILSDAGIEVSVACRTLESAKKLSSGVKNAIPISLDVTDPKALDAEVAKNDLVISLIPYTFHATVIESAIRNKKHVVTTSYVSPAMLELDAKAKEAGITVMNEIGLDPGIDHLYAIKTIEEVHKAGGKITSFLSYCGGLPAPEASDNPLGYKFSWSSRGVLLALRNAAKYYKDGKVVDIEGKDLMGAAKPYFIYPGYAFVAYPNRDSTPYKERYNIPEAQTIKRAHLMEGSYTKDPFCHFVQRAGSQVGYCLQDHLQGHRGEEPPYGRSQLGWDLLRREDHSPRQPTRHSLRNPREEDAVRGGRARFRHAATQVRDREQGWQ